MTSRRPQRVWLAMLLDQLNKCRDAGTLADTTPLLWSAMQSAAMGRRSSVQAGVNTPAEEAPALRMGLDIVAAVQELAVGHDLAALEAIESFAWRRVHTLRKRGRKRPDVDEGARFVEAAIVYLREECPEQEIAQRFAHAVKVSPRLCEVLGCTVTIGDEIAWSFPGQEAVTKAAAAIKKHRRLAERWPDPRRRARAVVQHAFEAFGLSKEDARRFAGLKTKGP
jgi:hypothetical protein